MPRRPKVADVHSRIQADARRLRERASAIPCYRPSEKDAPHIAKLVRAAVAYVSMRGEWGRAKSFVYEGRRYSLLYTNLDRLIVCDTGGNQLGASAWRGGA